MRILLLVAALLAAALLAASSLMGAAQPAASAQSVEGDPASELLADTALFPQAWSWTSLGVDIGRGGVVVADLDGDGSNEIVASAKSNGLAGYYWYILGGAPGSLQQVWTSPI